MRMTVLLGVVLAAVLVGCGSGDGAQDQPGVDAADPGATGPFFGQCGSVTDDEVVAKVGIPGLTTVTRNSIGCVWESTGIYGPSVSFSWYRGSPIDRERSGSELIGRPAEDIEIDGHEGFAAATDNSLCEVGIGFGKDFMHWSITYGDQVPTADPCEVAKDLAALTVDRAQ